MAYDPRRTLRGHPCEVDCAGILRCALLLTGAYSTLVPVYLPLFIPHYLAQECFRPGHVVPSSPHAGIHACRAMPYRFKSCARHPTSQGHGGRMTQLGCTCTQILCPRPCAGLLGACLLLRECCGLLLQQLRERRCSTIRLSPRPFR